MMLEKLLVILIILICSVNSTMAMTKDEISNGIIENCDRMYRSDTSDFVYCILSQSYAHNRIVRHFLAPSTDNEDHNKLRELIDKHKDKLKTFYGFVTLHLEFEEWVERKYKKDGI